MWGKYWNESMWNDSEVLAISHVSRKVLEAFEIPQVPDEVLGCKVWLVVICVTVKTAIHKILAFFICPKYTNALQIGKSADL